MPDVSKYEVVIDDFNKGTYPTLSVNFGTEILTAGVTFSKSKTESTPTLLAPPELSRQGVYTVVSIDLDAPYISFNVLSPIVHWVQTGLRIKEHGLELESDEDPIAYWAACNPPPGAAPHRYVFFLYEQKLDSAASDVQPLSLTQRLRFDVDLIVKQLGLGKLVAVNHFLSNYP